MTTATLTPETAVGELLVELSELLHRHDDGHEIDLDEAQEIRELLGRAARRFAGRVGRLRRKAAPPAGSKPEPAPAVKESLKPAEPGGAAARESNPHLRAAVDRPGAPTASAEGTAPTPLPPVLEKTVSAPTRVVPAPCRFSRVRRVLAMLAVLWVAIVSGVARSVRRFAAEELEGEVCIVCGPGCCSPVLGRHTSCPPAGGTVVAR